MFEAIEYINCVLCGGIANFACQRCFESYCSNNCQLMDWPQHKFICIPMPPLIPIDSMDTESASNMNNTEYLYYSKPSLRNVNNIQSNTNVTYKSNINDRIKKCGDTYKIRNYKVEQIRPTLMENPGFKKDYGIINNNTSPSLPVIPEKPITSKSSHDNLISKSIENINTCSKPWKIPFSFPKDKTDFQVTVQFVDQNAKLIWVTDISLDNDATKLLKQINENIQHADKANTNDINIDNIVAAPFTDGLYYRAIILDKINPKYEVRLRLVDYGNDFEININKLKLPIPIMEKLNAYAFCCRYNESVEIDKILNIRVVGKESEEIFIIEEVKETIQINN